MAASTTLRQRVPAKQSPAIVVDGSKGSSSSSSHQERDEPEIFTPPQFTVKDLLSVIPKHCYERSALRSSTYLFGDLAMLATFAYLATFIDVIFGKHGSVVDGDLGRALRIVSWAVYAFCAGSVGTGVWIIAHECGHQAFSASKTINNTVGWIFHSALLVPYHSWRISHARHHAATGSMERDEVFVPKTRSRRGLAPEADTVKAVQPTPAKEEGGPTEQKQETMLEAMDELFEDAPIWNLVNVFLQQTVGWPMYLIRNASGQDYGKWTSHFDPTAPIFDKRHFGQVLMSDLGIAITITVLTLWGMSRGSAEVVKFYLIPYLIVNHHLVMITYLQHTDPELPHYRKGEWNFQRGALCTIDRNMGGALGAFILHGICETHVAHHICSKIPHYHAWEATEALKAVLGEHYMKSEDNMYYSLYKNYSECKFVEDTGSCVFYKNRFGKARKVVAYEQVDSGVDVRDPEHDAEIEDY